MIDTLPNQLVHARMRDVSHRILYPLKNQRQVMLILVNGTADTSLALEDAKEYYLQHSNYTNGYVFVRNVSMAITGKREKFENSKVWLSPEWAPKRNLSSLKYILVETQLMLYSDPLPGVSTSQIASIVQYVPIQAFHSISLEGRNNEIQFPEFIHELRNKDINTVVADFRVGRQPEVGTLDNLGKIQNYAIPEVEVRGNYKNRVILQFERDPIVDKAAQSLFQKHSESSTLLFYDGQRTFRYDSKIGSYDLYSESNAIRLTAKDKLEIVGHGEQIKRGGKVETTLSDLTAHQLSTRLQNIPALRFGDAIGRISLVSCKLSPAIGEGKFDMTFPVEFQRQLGKTVKSDVVTRVDDLIVNPYGQKRNFRDTSRKADKFVVDSEGKIDFVTGQRVSETSVLSPSGPLGPNDNEIIKLVTENVIGSANPSRLPEEITATFRETVMSDTVGIFTIDSNRRSVEIFQPQIKDLGSIVIKKFVSGDDIINEVLKIDEELPTPYERNVAWDKSITNPPKKPNPDSLQHRTLTPPIYEIGDFLYMMKPLNLYIVPIGHLRFEVNHDLGITEANVHEINARVRKTLMKLTNRGSYPAIKKDAPNAESLMPKILSTLNGLEGAGNVNDALQKIIRSRNTGQQSGLVLDESTIREMAQLGTATLAIGVSECVRNYKTLAVNMMIAEIKSFSFDSHPMTKGGTWGGRRKGVDVYKKDTGFEGLLGENVVNEENVILEQWNEHLRTSNLEIVESKVFINKINEQEVLINNINELRALEQSVVGNSDSNVNIQEADQVHTSLATQEGLLKDHKELANKIHQKITETHPNKQFNDFDINKVTTLSDDRVLIEYVDKADKATTQTIEIMPEELSGHTEEKITEMKDNLGREQPGERPAGRSERLNKAMGYYGIVMGLQGGVRALQEGDIEHGLVGLGQFGHGLSALTGVNQKISNKIFQSIQTKIDKAAVSLAERTAEIAVASESKILLKTTSKLARFGELVPFVGIGFGAYMIQEDIKHAVLAKSPGDRAHFIVDAALDSTITGLDVIGSTIPEALVVTEPLVIALNIARIFIDDIWNDVTEELKKVQCPDHGTCFWKKLGAVLVGLLKGVRDVVLGVLSIFYYTPYKELQHTKEFKQQLADYHQYYAEVHKDGEPDVINFASGNEAIWGGDIHFILHNDNTAQFCYNLDGIKSCHTIVTESNSIVLGIGESQHIKYKTVTEKILLFIPVRHVKVMDGLEGISTSLTGYYEGNDADNNFFAIQELPQDANLGYSLSDYFYELHGNDGDDVFHLGPQRSRVIGGNGGDTYIIPKTGGHTVINNFAYDEKNDLLMLECSFASLFSRIDNSGDLILSYLDTHSVVVQHWIHGRRYQHLNFMAQPGVIFNVSQVIPLEPKLEAQAIYLNSEDHAYDIDLSVPLYDKVTSIIGTNYADEIKGNEQDNMINGGPGEDVLFGGNGQDHYIVKDGEGCDTINNKADDLLNDMLYMDIPIGRLAPRVHGRDLRLIDLNFPSTCVVLKDWFADEEYQHMTLTITDFILVKIETDRDCYDNQHCEPLLAFEINEMAATTGQTINAALPHLSHVTTIQGSPFRDRIYGNGITNFISGGSGRDLLMGRDGADYYIIKIDEGDKIVDNLATDGMVDTIMFPNRFDEIGLRKDHIDLVIFSQHVRVNVANWFRGVQHQHLVVKTTDGYTFTFTEQNSKMVKSILSIDKTKLQTPVFFDTSQGHHQSDTPSTLIFQILQDRMDDLETIPDCDVSRCNVSSTVEMYGSATYSMLVGNDLNNLIHAGMGGGYFKGGNGSDTYNIMADGTIKIVNNFAEDNAQDVIQINGEYSSFILSEQTLLTNDVRIDGKLNQTKLTLILENYKASIQNRHLVFTTHEGEIFDIISSDQVDSDLVKNQSDKECHKMWYKNPMMVDVSDRKSEQRVTLVDYPDDEAFYGVHGSQKESNHINGNKLDNNLLGGPKLDVIVGGDGDDILKGLAGDDVLDGGGGNDILFGGSDDDWLLGGQDNDIIVPGYGVDMINGGSGYDTVMYMGDHWQNTGVVVNLALTLGLFSDAEDDILENVESVYASEYNDILIGNDESNYLKSFAGDDILVSLSGNDILQGGSGFDYYVFDLANGYKEIDNCADDRKNDVILMRKSGATFNYNTTKGDLLITITNSSDTHTQHGDGTLTIKLTKFISDNDQCGHAFFRIDSRLLTFEEFQQECDNFQREVELEHEYSLYEYSLGYSDPIP